MSRHKGDCRVRVATQIRGTGRASVAAVAAGAMGASALVAVRARPPAWELAATARINAAPDVVAWSVWPVMQLGNALAPVVAGSIVWRTSGDVPQAVATAVSGVAAYVAAKAVKRLVRRGRPLAFLPGTHVREGDGSGFGFVSGHGAISAALAVTLGAALPPAVRLLLVAGAALTGVGRIVYGMHLPADVVGGWGLGALLGLAGVLAAGR